MPLSIQRPVNANALWFYMSASWWSQTEKLCQQWDELLLIVMQKIEGEALCMCFKENVHLFSHRQRAELEHTTHIVVGVLGGSLNPNLSLLDTGHLRLSLIFFHGICFCLCVIRQRKKCCSHNEQNMWGNMQQMLWLSLNRTPLFHANILIFQSGTVGSSWCATMIIGVPAFCTAEICTVCSLWKQL